jgi:hypothetical protein
MKLRDLTVQLSNVMPGAGPPMKLTYAAALVAFLVYFMGFLLSFFLPPEKLPE